MMDESTKRALAGSAANLAAVGLAVGGYAVALLALWPVGDFGAWALSVPFGVAGLIGGIAIMNKIMYG